MDKHNKLDELRQRYRKASSDEERASIVLEAKIIKGEAGFQCYFTDNGKRCENRQEDCWCSEEHKTAWQKENYNDNRARGEHQLRIPEIQKRLREMKSDVKM